MKILAIGMVRIYQWTISPFLGSCCRFYPTCSEYAVDALQHFGLFKGCFFSLKRLCKCHPLHPGGYDPIPTKKNRFSP